jgi:hypothetical protein
MQKEKAQMVKTVCAFSFIKDLQWKTGVKFRSSFLFYKYFKTGNNKDNLKCTFAKGYAMYHTTIGFWNAGCIGCYCKGHPVAA